MFIPSSPPPLPNPPPLSCHCVGHPINKGAREGGGNGDGTANEDLGDQGFRLDIYNPSQTTQASPQRLPAPLPPPSLCLWVTRAASVPVPTHTALSGSSGCSGGGSDGERVRHTLVCQSLPDKHSDSPFAFPIFSPLPPFFSCLKSIAFLAALDCRWMTQFSAS